MFVLLHNTFYAATFFITYKEYGSTAVDDTTRTQYDPIDKVVKGQRPLSRTRKVRDEREHSDLKEMDQYARTKSRNRERRRQ